MAFTSSHFGLHVRDLPAARRFYVDQLCLPVLQEAAGMNMFAVRAGSVRLSVFGDRRDTAGEGPCQIMLATGDIEATVAELTQRGVVVNGPPATAPGFMRFVKLHDPDGNEIGVVQYLRDPLVAV